MSLTNSNSITSLLIYELNNNSSFRENFISYINKQIKKKTSLETIKNLSLLTFYDGTHQPLIYKEMKGKEIDIFAREKGKQIPKLLIEVKAGIYEPLQKSQSKGHEYQKTAEKYQIPLIYIYPKEYSHKDNIPETAIIVTWEEIITFSNDDFKAQIMNFVDLCSEAESENEKNITFLEKIKGILLNYNRKLYSNEPQNNVYGVGYYYKYNGFDLFIGKNPTVKGFEDALAIYENLKNFEYLNSKEIYYEDGYYFISINQIPDIPKNEAKKNGIDLEVLEEYKKIVENKRRNK